VRCERWQAVSARVVRCESGVEKLLNMLQPMLKKNKWKTRITPLFK
jgi:hypothetical protein